MRNLARLFSQTKGRQCFGVKGGGDALEIGGKLAPPRDERHQSAPRVLVVFVGVEMGGEVDNARGQAGNLHLGRTNILVMQAQLEGRRGGCGIFFAAHSFHVP